MMKAASFSILFVGWTLVAQERALLQGSLGGIYPIKRLIFKDGRSAGGNDLYPKVGTLIVESIRSELQSRVGQKLSEAAQDGNADVGNYFEGIEFQKHMRMD